MKECKCDCCKLGECNNDDHILEQCFHLGGLFRWGHMSVGRILNLLTDGFEKGLICRDCIETLDHE